MTESGPTGPELEELVHQAFPAAPIPTHVFTNTADEDLRPLVGKPWTTLTIHDWRMTGTGVMIAMLLMTPDAFRYYLPSLLISSLKDPSDFEYSLQALVPPNQKHEPRGIWWDHYITGFTAPQKHAVISFLRFSLSHVQHESEDEYFAKLALDQFWKEQTREIS